MESRIYIKGKQINAPEPMWLGSAWEWPKIQEPPLCLQGTPARIKALDALVPRGKLTIPWRNARPGYRKTQLQGLIALAMKFKEKGKKFTCTSTDDGVLITRVK